MLDSCSGIAAVLLAVTAKVSFFDCSSLCNNQFFNQENPGIFAPGKWDFLHPRVQKIPRFGTESRGGGS